MSVSSVNDLVDQGLLFLTVRWTIELITTTDDSDYIASTS